MSTENTPLDIDATVNTLEDPTLPQGLFLDKLTRDHKKIKAERAIEILEKTETYYRRVVEDLQLELKGVRRDRSSMLDLSPDDTTSLKVASDFNEKAFVDKDIELGVRERKIELRLEIASKRYNSLFKAAQ